MPRIRSIKPEFFTSDVVAELSIRARLTWIGLWTHCDDEGRCKDNARLIAAALYPLDSYVTADDVATDLDELARSGRIVRYVVDSRPYLQVTNWKEHQKPNRPQGSKLPSPSDGEITKTPAHSHSVNAHGERSESSVNDQCELTARSSGAVEGSSGEGAVERRGNTRASAPPTPRATRIPADFTVTDDMIQWARENTPLVGRNETDKFVDYWRAKSGKDATKRDWVATWRNWMRRAQDDAERRNHRPPARTTKDERVSALDAFLVEETEPSEPTVLRALPGGAA